MRRDPALTYRGALNILGHYERPVVEKLDRLLGGVILSGGVLAGAVAVGGPALAPLAGLAAVWGWVDQKNEAMGLLRKIVDNMSDRLLGTSGYDRHQLIMAAHTTIVASSFFDALNEWLGGKAARAIYLREDEREMLVTGAWRDSRESFFDAIYNASVPSPSVVRGFEENVQLVRNWLTQLCGRTEHFFNGLEAWNPISRNRSMASVTDRAEQKYRSYYLQLASTVPEFLVWASINEHAATRYQMGAIHADIQAAFDGEKMALSRIEQLLTAAIGPGGGGDRDLTNIINRANKGALADLIVPIDVASQQEPISFPTVGRIYVNPRCRIARYTAATLPSNEEWWQDQTLCSDLDVILAAHVSSVDATRLPLLILGHPGAGKSLFTKVLAARLPVQSYTVIRVPLRRVSSDAPIYEQIQQALDLSTHKRVEWYELADASQSTIRVVLLDGLDELLQASVSHRASYLLDVAEFQRREAEQHRPVIVIVTSRTIVADRVEISDGTPIIKLEEFDEDQISSWLSIWHEENISLISEGKLGMLSLESALSLVELSSQPLLLMMLALYSSDPFSPPLSAETSSADVYHHLLVSFLARELSKHRRNLRPDQVDEAVRHSLWQLSIAAFAMFNRGRQDVTDVELGNDIAALNGDQSTSIDTVTLGRELVGRFFFIHTAEAQVEGKRATRRSYEFLHATFGEYLVAAQIIEVIENISTSNFEFRRGMAEPNDDLLFALLSHQPIAIRGQIAIFISEIFQNLSTQKQQSVLHLLVPLLANCRKRHVSDRYGGYRPLQLDRVRQTGAYSANLVLLRVLLAGESVALGELFPAEGDLRNSWQSVVDLWRASLDENGWNAILDTFRYDDGEVRFEPGSFLGSDFRYSAYARLIGDKRLESWVRVGMAVQGKAFYGEVGEDLADVVMPWMASFFIPFEYHRSSYALLPKRPTGSRKSIQATLSAIDELLKLGSRSFTYETLSHLLEWRISFRTTRELDPYSLASAIWVHPKLVIDIPEILDPELYRSAAGAILMIFLAEIQSDSPAKDSLKQLREAIEIMNNSAEGVIGPPLDVERPEFMLAADALEAFVAQRHARFIEVSIFDTGFSARPSENWIDDQEKPELL